MYGNLCMPAKHMVQCTRTPDTLCQADFPVPSNDLPFSLLKILQQSGCFGHQGR